MKFVIIWTLERDVNFWVMTIFKILLNLLIVLKITLSYKLIFFLVVNNEDIQKIDQVRAIQ